MKCHDQPGLMTADQVLLQPAQHGAAFVHASCGAVQNNEVHLAVIEGIVMFRTGWQSATFPVGRKAEQVIKRPASCIVIAVYGPHRYVTQPVCIGFKEAGLKLFIGAGTVGIITSSHQQIEIRPARTGI